ncbi:MAG: class I SAM-dependent methyltransferase [Candidatus Eisenbacteria bacterium]
MPTPAYTPRWTWNRYARTIARAPGSPLLEQLHREQQDRNPERTPIDPGSEGTLEHLSRYLLARPLVRGRRVIDGGCGYGYGSMLLSRWGAREVLACDYDRAAVAQLPRADRALKPLNASLSALPLPPGSVDVVVAMEVIEHLAEPERFLEETRRVLTPDGILLLSTPNRELVSPGWQRPPNRFHLREWSAAEFRRLLSAVFACVELQGQIPGPRLIARREAGRGARKLAIQIERATGWDPRSAIPSGVRALLRRGRPPSVTPEAHRREPTAAELATRVRSFVALGSSSATPELDGYIATAARKRASSWSLGAVRPRKCASCRAAGDRTDGGWRTHARDHTPGA